MKTEMTLLKEVANKVEQAGGKMYFVGGFVRDRLLGKESKDIDVEVHGITETKLVEILKTFGQVDLVGESFGVYLIKGVDIDFAMPRTERKTGDKHTDFDVTVDPFIGTYEASKRRDFTMNAIMEDVMTGYVIDHFKGVEDIENCVIRLVDDVTFKEDALRVLRAIQFSARFGFEIECDTQEVMKEMDLTHLAKERIYMEIEKGMTKGCPKKFITEMKKYPSILEILPSLEKVETENLLKENELTFNTVMMSLHMDEVSFQGCVHDMIQDKQGRKLASATRAFIQAIRKAKTAEDMALAVSIHRGFVEKQEVFVQKNRSTLFDDKVNSLFTQIVNQKNQVSFMINGDWLMFLGVKPSPRFKQQLDEAHALSFLGLDEGEIKQHILMEGNL